VPERACKAGALPAELHAPCNYMILIVSLIESREIDYLLYWQVLPQTDLPTHHEKSYHTRYLRRFLEQLQN
jgi:hypothetical protein